MSHVILIGDSVFDNGAYVGTGPSLIQQLTEMLPGGWRATLLAVDGSLTQDARRQLRELPADATHVVISVGGNDALGYFGVLSEGAHSTVEVLTKLSNFTGRFEEEYREMLGEVEGCGLPAALCTIYNPRYPDPELQRIAVVGLMIFNDCIIRGAFKRGLPLIDLRLICDDDADYANPIEPSVQGGEKIASTVVELLTAHEFTHRRTQIYANHRVIEKEV
jgi:hypothetical protein